MDLETSWSNLRKYWIIVNAEMFFSALYYKSVVRNMKLNFVQ